MAQPETAHGNAEIVALAHLGALPFGLIDEPLEYILAVHGQQRCICAALRSVASRGSIARAAADRIVAFLTRDLVLHHQDEDEDLFPALRKRAHPEDNLGAILARLSDDHLQSARMIESLIDTLTAHPAKDPIGLKPRQTELMQAYAAGEHRHLSIENAIVLVIARKRLTGGDLAAISRAMKARRGVHH